MLNKMELAGREPRFYAVVLSKGGVPKGSYLYKTRERALEKFEAFTVPDGFKLEFHQVSMTWAPQAERRNVST